MLFEALPVGPLQCHCCLIGYPVSKRVITRDHVGDSAKIVASIKKRLFTMHDDFHLIIGHDSSTSIGAEKSENPSLRS